MTYKLKFRQQALKEWRKLAPPIRDQFRERLLERLENPRIESARLHSMKDSYKIKLRAAGYRLVYQVRDAEVVVSVVAVGKRERNAVYSKSGERIK